MLPGMELMSCPNLAVPRDVMHHVVRVESSYNPYAIGVVGGRLVRQPRSLAEAVSTARMLEQRGYNFSLGLAQVNRYNLTKYGLTSYEHAFQPCANLVAGSQILRECYSRSGGDWGKSFSCYYSGDFRTGFRHGYVQKVYASMRRGGGLVTLSEGNEPVAVVERTSRRAGRSVGEGGTLVQRRTHASAASRSAHRNSATPAAPMQWQASSPSLSRPVVATAAPNAGASAPSASGYPVAVAATAASTPSVSSQAVIEPGDGAFVF